MPSRSSCSQSLLPIRMYTYTSPSGHLFRKDKATMNCCPIVAPQNLHSCPPSLLHFIQMINPELHSVLHTKPRLFVTPSLSLPVFCLLCGTPSAASPAPLCSISEPLSCLPLTTHALGSPCTAADGEPHWCWARRRQLSGCEGVCTWVRLGEDNGDGDLPGLNSGGFYLINSYRQNTLFPQVRHTG